MPEVIRRLLVPRSIEPDVAVIDKAPVVWVNPLEAVKVPAEVIVPVPVVEILPEVDRTPFSLMVKVGVPPDWMDREVLVAPPLVSLITMAVVSPALARVNEVDRPDDRVKAMFLPAVVSMVLPPLYADCRVMESEEQATTLLELSRHTGVPVDDCRPFKIMFESVSVLKVMLLVP